MSQWFLVLCIWVQHTLVFSQRFHSLRCGYSTQTVGQGVLRDAPVPAVKGWKNDLSGWGPAKCSVKTHRVEGQFGRHLFRCLKEEAWWEGQWQWPLECHHLCLFCRGSLQHFRLGLAQCDVNRSATELTQFPQRFFSVL